MIVNIIDTNQSNTKEDPRKKILNETNIKQPRHINPIHFETPIYTFDNSSNEQIIVNNNQNSIKCIIIISIIVIITIGCFTIGNKL